MSVMLTPLDAESPVDQATALRLALACEAAVGIADTTAEEIEALATGPDAERGAHRLARTDVQAEPVGALFVDLDRTGRDVHLTPFAVGADAGDVYDALLADALVSAAGIAAADPTGDVAADPFDGDPYSPSAAIWQCSLGMFRGEQALADAVERAGFRHVRAFYRMFMPLPAEMTSGAAAPGLSLRIARGDDDLRTLHALRNATFAEHFGSSHDHPFDEWVASMRAMPGHDPERLFIAARDGRDIGLLVMDDSRWHDGEDYLRTLGVLADERGRGTGRWILQQAIAMATARGATGLSLGVDTDNTSNATALYESVGMRPRHVIDVYVRPVADRLR